jgi:hypothetical protein
MEGISEIVNKKPLFIKTSAILPQGLTFSDLSVNKKQTLSHHPWFKRVSVMFAPRDSGK